MKTDLTAIWNRFNIKKMFYSMEVEYKKQIGYYTIYEIKIHKSFSSVVNRLCTSEHAALLIAWQIVYLLLKGNNRMIHRGRWATHVVWILIWYNMIYVSNWANKLIQKHNNITVRINIISNYFCIPIPASTYVDQQ